jgi:hypothetical protein
MNFTIFPKRIKPVMGLQDYAAMTLATVCGSILLIILALGFIGWMFHTFGF